VGWRGRHRTVMRGNSEGPWFPEPSTHCGGAGIGIDDVAAGEAKEAARKVAWVGSRS